MSSSKVIAAISFDDGKIYREIDEIKSQAEHYDTATRIVHVLISQAAGDILGQVKGDIIAELPVDNVECLREIVDQIAHTLPLRCNVGVGEDSRCAMAALKQGKAEKKPIKVYTKELGDQPVEKSEDLSKADEPDFQPIDHLDKQKLEAAVQSLQQNKPLFDQMKQSAPELYQAVVAVAMSLAEIVEADKESKEAHQQKTVDTINKHLESNNEKYKQEKENMINEILLRLLAEQGHEETGEYYGDPGHTGDSDWSESDFDYEPASHAKSEDAELSKAEISEETKARVVAALKLISDSKEILQSVHQSNPEAIEALAQMVGSLGKIFEEQTGGNINAQLDQSAIEDHLKEHQKAKSDAEDRKKAPHINKPEDIHGRKLVFGPGAVRQYNPKDARRKNEQGEWENVSSDAKEGSV